MINKRVGQSIRKLRKDIDKISDEYLEQMYRVIKRAIAYYPDDWDDNYKVIINLIYRALEKIYRDTSYSLKRIFSKTEAFNIKNIADLTYSKDGKTLEERFKQYWDIAEEKVLNKEKSNEIALYLLNRFAIIAATEGRTVEEAVIKNKKPIPERDDLYVVQVIEGCGGECESDCLNYNGIYPEDEEIPWPPYHPNCTGIAYYDITDDLDEIHDLDLNDEDE